MEESKYDKIIYKDHLSLNEVLAYMSIGRTTLEEWRVQGLPCYRVGKRTYYSKQDIREFLKKYEV